MKKNSLMRYIDSCVSNIARKIQDEFDESKHPRDEVGKFTTKGGEGTGGGSEETSRSENTKKSTVKIDPETEDNIRNTFEYDLAAIENDAESEEEYIKNAITHLQWTLEDTADTDERAMDNYGADAKTVAAVVNKMIEEFKGKEPTEYGMSYEEQEEMDNVLSALTQYASDKETADILLDRLNWDKEGLSTEDEYAMAIESAVQRDPKKAKELLNELNEFKSESPTEVSKRLNWTQHGETLSDDVMFYKTEDGWTFESDYLADEYVDKSFDSIEQAQKYYKKVMSQQTGASSLRNKELDDVDNGASEEQGEEPKETTPEVTKEKSAVEIDPDVEHTIRSEVEYDLDSIWGDAESIREYVDNAVAHLENTLADTASTDYAADVNYGASKEQVEAVFRKLIDEIVEENKSRIEEEENDPGYGKNY